MIVQFTSIEEKFELLLETNATPYEFIDAIKNGGIQSIKETLSAKGKEATWIRNGVPNAEWLIEEGALKIS